MEKIGLYAVPALIGIIVLTGLCRRIDLLKCFQEGAKEGLGSLVSVAPTLIGLIIGVNMLSASGFFELMAQWMAPVCRGIGVPQELLPLGLIRPVSGSGATAVLSSILTKYGPDSLIGKAASVMAGSTETTFYAVAVYYGAVGIRQTRYTIPAALMADICGMIGACLFTRLMLM